MKWMVVRKKCLRFSKLKKKMLQCKIHLYRAHSFEKTFDNKNINSKKKTASITYYK